MFAVRHSGVSQDHFLFTDKLGGTRVSLLYKKGTVFKTVPIKRLFRGYLAYLITP